MSTAPKPIVEIISLLAGGLFGLFYLGGIGVISLGKQSFHYLDSGDWISLSGIELIISMNAKLFFKPKLWAAEPSELLGLHEIFSFINGGTLFIAAGIAIYILSYIPMHQHNEKYRA